MKIPFDIKFKPQIESGEYKVVTSFGEPAEIVKWDCKGQYPLLACIFDGDTDDAAFYTEEGKRVCNSKENYLFIVTPEPELSKFDDCVRRLIDMSHSLGKDHPNNTDKGALLEHYSAELLALAREELFANDTVLKEYAQVSREQGKAEALRTHAIELTKNLDNSGLDKDSIPYHLIDFMCNLYTCPNWEEIEETAEAYVTRIKAAAMKDLPRWRKWGNGACGNGQGIPLAIVKRGLNGYELVDALGIQGEQYIMLSDLEKLPGFNE